MVRSSELLDYLYIAWTLIRPAVLGAGTFFGKDGIDLDGSKLLLNIRIVLRRGRCGGGLPGNGFLIRRCFGCLPLLGFTGPPPAGARFALSSAGAAFSGKGEASCCAGFAGGWVDRLGFLGGRLPGVAGCRLTKAVQR